MSIIKSVTQCYKIVFFLHFLVTTWDCRELSYLIVFLDCQFVVTGPTRGACSTLAEAGLHIYHIKFIFFMFWVTFDHVYNPFFYFTNFIFANFTFSFTFISWSVRQGRFRLSQAAPTLGRGWSRYCKWGYKHCCQGYEMCRVMLKINVYDYYTMSSWWSYLQNYLFLCQ